MKKIIFLILYFVFITIIEIMFLNISLSLNDYCNLLFVNINSFHNYGLSVYNIQYIISFYILFIILANFNVSYLYENVSFLSLIIYRKGKRKTIKDILINIILDLAKYYIVLSIILVIISFFINRIALNINTLYTYIVIAIYLIKFLLIIFLLIFKNLIDSLNNNFSINIIKLYILPFILILIDIIINTNLITFSNNIFLELIYLILYIIITIIYYYLKVIRGGKNDRG